MFKIGEFSRLVRISPRMLRHYEKCGLLEPIQIDPFSGYRMYSADQIAHAQQVVLLRDLGFSIDEIGALLPHMEDPVHLGRMLRAKADLVRSAIQLEQAKLDRLLDINDTLLKERNIMVHEVELKQIPSVKVLSLRGIIPQYNQEGILWEKLGRYIGENQIACHSDGYSTYFDDEHMDANPDVEIAIPVDTLGESVGEFIYQEYASIPLAATVLFTGPFDGGYDAASEKLAKWMEANDYTFAGPLRGHVLVSPDDAKTEDDLKTELQAPVKKR